MYASPYGPRMPPANGWGGMPPPRPPWSQDPWTQWSQPPWEPRPRVPSSPWVQGPPVNGYRPPPARPNLSYNGGNGHRSRYYSNWSANGVNGPRNGRGYANERTTTNNVDDFLDDPSATWESIEPREKWPEKKWRVTKLRVEPTDETAPYGPDDPYAADQYVEYSQQESYSHPPRRYPPYDISPSPVAPRVYSPPYYRPRYPPAPSPMRYPAYY